MPLPAPKSGDNQKEFVSRCMANPKMIAEYPREDQRLAVCYQQWKNGGK
jgi:hypothetical protein